MFRSASHLLTVLTDAVGSDIFFQQPLAVPLSAAASFIKFRRFEVCAFRGGHGIRPFAEETGYFSLHTLSKAMQTYMYKQRQHHLCALNMGYMYKFTTSQHASLRLPVTWWVILSKDSCAPNVRQFSCTRKTTLFYVWINSDLYAVG